MQSILKKFSVDSLAALGILGSAAVVQIFAIAVGRMPETPGYAFAGFALSGAMALFATHKNPTRSRRMRMAESIVGSIAGAAFLSVAVYSLFEKV